MIDVKNILCGIHNKIKYFHSLIGLYKNDAELIIPKNKTTYEYKDLAPNEQLDYNSEYFSALEWAFNQPHIYNIAIAGPYGSGKSSIIQTYIKNHRELKYINISLANFLEVIEKDGEEIHQLTDYEEDRLEVGILKQLFYKVKYHRIPQSRYRKLHSISYWKVVNFVIKIIVLGVLIGAFIGYDIKTYVDNALKNAVNNLNLSNMGARCLGVVLLICLVRIISYLIRFLLSRVRVKEINLADKGVADFGQTEENSIFNRNMDEIVYFFEETKYNVVFIEDLDRFKQSKIFTKLRELNTILNNYEAIKKKIVFIYAVREDMFSYEDRTKFFEFILPVIPIINATNSGELLLERMKNDSVRQYPVGITEDYITLVSPYIDDMRILNNIYNEFIIYKVTLQGQQELKLNDQMMFSMMVFKNLYPKDFADLQAEKGIIKDAFNGKQKFVINMKRELENEKQKIICRIESAENDILNSVREIKSAMLFYMTGNNGRFEYLYVNGKYYYFAEIMEENFDIKQLKGTGDVRYINNSGYSRNREFNGDVDFSGSNDYIKRCQDILLRIPQQKEKYQNRIDILNYEISKLESMSLKEMLCLYPPDKVLSENVCANKLVVFLLRKGFIDEKYPNYINYFHASSITRDDMNYILSIRNQEALPFSYALSRCEQVIKRLLPYEFEQKEVYNFDLMDQLLKSEKEVEKRNRLFNQLADEHEISWRFIDEYWDRTQNQDKFIILLCDAWSELWNVIYFNSILSEERKKNYFISICKNASIEVIKKLNQENSIKKYCEENSDILTFFDEIGIEKVKEIIIQCYIRFSDLNIEDVNEKLVEWIFENRYYCNTLPIFKSIFKWKKAENMNDLYIKNYSAILQLRYRPLLENLYAEFEKYIKDIVLSLETNCEESLNSVLDIIERGQNIDDIQCLIRKENIFLDDFERCLFERYLDNKEALNTIWSEWMNCQKVKPSWKNVFLYREYFGSTNCLIAFLEKNMDLLISDDNSLKWDTMFIEEIFKSNLDAFSFSKFIQIIPKVEWNIPLSMIPVEHMKILIMMQYFDFSGEFARELKETYLDLNLYPMSLIVNKDYVIKNPDEFYVETSELDILIESKMLEDDEKLCFVEQYATNPYSNKVALFLRITKLKLSKTVFQNTWKVLEISMRYELLINQIEIFDKEGIANLLSQLDSEYQKFADRSRRHDEKLVDNDYNRKLVEYLKKIGYISSYKEKNVQEGNKMLICRIRKEN